MSHAVRDLIRAQVQEAHDSGDSRRETAARVQLEANEAAGALRARWASRFATPEPEQDAA